MAVFDPDPPGRRSITIAVRRGSRGRQSAPLPHSRVMDVVTHPTATQLASSFGRSRQRRSGGTLTWTAASHRVAEWKGTCGAAEHDAAHLRVDPVAVQILSVLLSDLIAKLPQQVPQEERVRNHGNAQLGPAAEPLQKRHRSLLHVLVGL
eukprot:CAMPEP_0179123692 /NCGR_PEP_ID=MMETSP0796-20121207/58424_1 /TAXON_ID=73915 /ORGANISM="Pyrodinium bahamense, Strain pbaha01" /LENGTH=149 /DNA_ID=CAMNT_0020822337 /DNA_START=61 /DNA_END=508 /DNA_ORIENTATION=-